MVTALLLDDIVAKALAISDVQDSAGGILTHRECLHKYHKYKQRGRESPRCLRMIRC